MPAERSRRPDTSRADTALYRPAAMLIVTAPPAQAGRSVAVDPTGTVLGRDITCDLALSSEHISRRHAVVRADDSGGYVVADLGSRNGTMLNGDRILGAVPLRDGDRLTLADAAVEFQLTGLRTPPARSAPRSGEAWWPDEPTQSSEQIGGPGRSRPPSLRQQLQEAQGFSTRALLLAVAGSVVGTVLTSATGTGPWGSLAGAALAPIISTAFSTTRAGEKGRVRTAAIVILSAVALAITWGGVSLADLATGSSVIPGAGERPNTFPAPKAKDSTPRPDPTSHPSDVPAPSTTVTEGPAIEAKPPLLDCGTAAVGSNIVCLQPVTIRSIGRGWLHITSVELNGVHSPDFTAGPECVDKWLDTGDTCTMQVGFHPAATGPRRVTLVIHQNLPPPDRGTTISVAGVGRATPPDRCITGYVWREAVAGDHVCVTPETRSQAQRDNSLAESRRSPNGGAYGPDTCIEGYVWREAVAGDHVCVTPNTRDLTRQDNALADSRRVH